jgi:hypothetical protein
MSKRYIIKNKNCNVHVICNDNNISLFSVEVLWVEISSRLVGA